MRHAVDFNNFTILTNTQGELLKATQDFVIVGLEDLAISTANVAKLGAMEVQWYLNRPGLDLSLCQRGDMVWIDIEPGCFVTAQDVRDQGTLNTSLGLRTGIYCNRTSLQPVFGDSSELADFGCPLWYANYIPPRWDWFVPFNGWTRPDIWQYSSKGLDGINCDLNIAPMRPMIFEGAH